MKLQNSIILITYNQENLVSRAINSIISQKEWIYEIIISDDHSKDNTWNVIKSYEKKFPNLIKPFRNKQNLGIQANIEGTWSKVTGNIIWHLAGDDEFCDGVFQKSNEFILRNNLDLENDAFTIYFDYKEMNSDGSLSVLKNNYISSFNPVSLKVRELISNRTTCFSSMVLQNFSPVNKDIGIAADGLYDIQLQFLSKENYYIPFVGSIYHKSIGISSQSSNCELINSQILFWEELKENQRISTKDRLWITYRISSLLYRSNPDLKTLITCVKYFCKATELKYGVHFIVKELKNLLIIILISSFKSKKDK